MTTSVATTTTSDPVEKPSVSSKTRRIGSIILVALIVLFTTAAILLAHYWPFTQKDIIETLEETIPGTKVSVGHFHITYLQPGCWTERLVFVRKASPSGAPPLVTVRKLIITASYADMFFRPRYISRIVIEGLQIQIPARGTSHKTGEKESPASATTTRTVVGEIMTKDALLEIARKDDAPLKFEVRNLTLFRVGIHKSMAYNVDVRNALPPGEIHASGHLGPWNADDLGQIPVSGTYKFSKADLGVFDGIAGTLSSIGQFDGKLGQIGVAGDTDMLNFTVKLKGHAVQLNSHFEAEVNGTNGNVKLNQVNVKLENTAITVHGVISGQDSNRGKITALDVASGAGRVQDILRPFVKAKNPPMTGPITFRAHIIYPSVEHPFLKKVSLTGDFAIKEGSFPSPDTQNSVDSLSERSRGLKENAAPTKIETNLSSHVVLSGGVAKFSNLSMDVPGAVAEMNGTFNIVSEKLDFHGTLKTDVKLSETTHGIKSALLKPLDPLFKRKRGGASIPVAMTGTYSRPHFGMEVIPKH